MDGSDFRKDAFAFLLSSIILSWDSLCAFNIRGKKRPDNIIRNIAFLAMLTFFINNNFFKFSILEDYTISIRQKTCPI